MYLVYTNWLYMDYKIEFVTKTQFLYFSVNEINIFLNLDTGGS